MARPYPQPTAIDDPKHQSQPHTARRRPPPSFYLSSTGVSPSLIPSDAASASSRSTARMSVSSLPSTPAYSRRPSHRSLVALRNALQTYQIASPDRYYSNPDTPSVDTPASPVGNLQRGTRMDALVEIHRVLYRGREDQVGEALPWSVQGMEIRRVFERWFETDCCEFRLYRRGLYR